MRMFGALAALLFVAFQAPPQPAAAPLVDHHQHLFSPASTRITKLEPLDAADLISYLDAAGIRRATVLSVAYTFASPNRGPVDNEYQLVREENDWTSRQVARFPDRLRGFCGVNPLKDYALDEIARCAKDVGLRTGLKLHFGNSDVQLDNPEHVRRLHRVFRAANDRRMAIVVHLHANISQRRPYGAREVRVFLNELLPAAPDVVVQIAHLAGGGPLDDEGAEEALSVFVDAVANRDPRMAHVYFDVSGIAGLGNWSEHLDHVAARLRQLGLPRVLFGCDGARGGNLAPRECWAAFRQLPLSDAEFGVIGENVAPYMK